jgi:hypothetical protein
MMQPVGQFQVAPRLVGLVRACHIWTTMHKFCVWLILESNSTCKPVFCWGCCMQVAPSLAALLAVRACSVCNTVHKCRVCCR